MSKSKPNQKSNNTIPALGLGFEVGRSVCDCYLKKISVKEKMYQDVPFYRIYLHFVKNNVWITKFISVLPPEAFNSEKEYGKAKLDVQMSLENLMACYLSSSHMKHINQQGKSSSIVGLVKDIEIALTEKRFWDTPVCLKTIPEKNGGVSIARFTPFMKPKEDSNWELSYSNWELKKVAEWHESKSK